MFVFDFVTERCNCGKCIRSIKLRNNQKSRLTFKLTLKNILYVKFLNVFLTDHEDTLIALLRITNTIWIYKNADGVKYINFKHVQQEKRLKETLKLMNGEEFLKHTRKVINTNTIYYWIFLKVDPYLGQSIQAIFYKQKSRLQWCELYHDWYINFNNTQ